MATRTSSYRIRSTRMAAQEAARSAATVDTEEVGLEFPVVSTTKMGMLLPRTLLQAGYR